MKSKKKTILITGSSRGLGEALAVVFASNSYNVILHGRDKELLEELKKTIVGRNKDVECDIVHGDIRLEDTIFRLSDIAREKDIDILVNNAGVYMNEKIEDMTFTDFRKVIDINLTAPMLLTYDLFPLFKRKQSGLIININSIAGKSGGDGETAYCASKYGLSGFSKALRFDAVRNNIRVVDIYPGGMKTDMSNCRKNQSKFMDPWEVARFIFNTCCLEHKSMRINEIEIGRKIY